MPKKIVKSEDIVEDIVKTEEPIKKVKTTEELQEMVNAYRFQWSNDFTVVKVEDVYCVSKEGQLIMWSKEKGKCDKTAKLFNMSAKKAMGAVSRSDATL